MSQARATSSPEREMEGEERPGPPTETTPEAGRHQMVSPPESDDELSQGIPNSQGVLRAVPTSSVGTAGEIDAPGVQDEEAPT